MVPVSWPAGVERRLQREGYTREPQDVVRRLKPDAGPALRSLLDGACAERVKGTLALTDEAFALWQAFHSDELDRGMRSFDWIITDNGAAVIARLAAQPKISKTAARWRLELDIACEAPEPASGALAALAALDTAGPAAWPAAVPWRPQRSAWSLTPEDGVLRSPDDGVQRQALTSRADGAVQEVTLSLTPEQKAAFEVWFRTVAAFGARDVSFPSASGGVHRGHFHKSYRVAPARSALWAVSFPVYLEAIA